MTIKSKPSVGLVLSGGAAKGLAHVGVLKELKKHKIQIDMVAGNSMGGLVGVLYAATLDPDRIEKLALGLNARNVRSVADFNIGPGFIKGQKLESVLKYVLPYDNFKRLKIPCFVNATNFRTGKEVIIDKGSLIKAIRTTISIPIVFNPVVRGKKTVLVDGALVDPLPVSVLKGKVDIIIAVDVTKPNPMIHQNLSYGAVIEQTVNVMEHNLARDSVKIYKPDIIIEPKVSKVSLFDFDNPYLKIKAGELAAKKKIREIKRIIEDKS